MSQIVSPHLYSDTDCETGGSYYICATACTDRVHYPLGLYPGLAGIYGYESSKSLTRSFIMTS